MLAILIDGLARAHFVSHLHEQARAMAEGTGPMRRLGQYRRHPELGEELLRAAGAPELAAFWAADHHRPAAMWRVPADVGAVLKACDDD